MAIAISLPWGPRYCTQARFHFRASFVPRPMFSRLDSTNAISSSSFSGRALVSAGLLSLPFTPRGVISPVDSGTGAIDVSFSSSGLRLLWLDFSFDASFREKPR